MASMLGTQSSGSSMSGTANQHIPQFDINALKTLFGTANTTFKNSNKSTLARTPAVQRGINSVASKSSGAWADLLKGGAFKGVNPGAVLSKIAGFQDTPSQTSQLYAQMMGGKGNNYADAMKNEYIKDADRTRELNYANLDARAAGAGMSGGSRHGVAQALIDRDINANLQKNLATTGYETFDKDLANKLGIAQQADSNMLARQNMYANTGNSFINARNANTNAGIAGAGNMQNVNMGMFAPGQMPWSNLQNYASAIGNPIILTNSTQRSSSESGK
jgi:hypothetical protein